MATITELEDRLKELACKYNALVEACQPIVKACKYDDLLVDRVPANVQVNHRVVVINEDCDLLTTAHLYAIVEQIVRERI